MRRKKDVIDDTVNEIVQQIEGGEAFDDSNSLIGIEFMLRKNGFDEERHDLIEYASEKVTEKLHMFFIYLLPQHEHGGELFYGYPNRQYVREENEEGVFYHEVGP
jgi:hypothetical protein